MASEQNESEIARIAGGAPVSQNRRSYKFDEDAMGRFLRNYMMTGQVHASALAAGVSEETIRVYAKNNFNGFGDLYAEAKGMFRDTIEAEIQRRAIEGVEEPILGGRNHDQIVAHVKKYSDRLLEFLAKRHIPEYRDRQQVDLNVAGGVMVVPARPTNQEAWSEEYGQIPRPEDE